MTDKQMMTPLMKAEMNKELRLAVAEIASRYGVIMPGEAGKSMADLFRQMQSDINDIAAEIKDLRSENVMLRKALSGICELIVKFPDEDNTLVIAEIAMEALADSNLGDD